MKRPKWTRAQKRKTKTSRRWGRISQRLGKARAGKGTQ